MQLMFVALYDSSPYIAMFKTRYFINESDVKFSQTCISTRLMVHYFITWILYLCALEARIC